MEEGFLDDEKLILNLENGFVALTQLCCFYESFLNTIINSCIGYDKEPILKCSRQEKLEIILMYYGKSDTAIKGSHAWEVVNKSFSVRNELIHYKKTYKGMGSGVPDFKIGPCNVASFFVKNAMEDNYTHFKKLASIIATEIGLSIDESVGIIECDGRDGRVNYVMRPS